MNKRIDFSELINSVRATSYLSTFSYKAGTKIDYYTSWPWPNNSPLPKRELTQVPPDR